MKMLGVVILALALVVAAVPQFYNCQADGKALTLTNGKQVPMKCYWTAQAELGLAVPLAGVGGMLAFSRRRETQRSLSIMGVILGGLVVLLPTALIGVCTTMTCSCNLVMRPAMIMAGGLTMAMSLGALLRSQLQLRAEPAS